MKYLPFVERKIIELLLNTATANGAELFEVSDEEEIEYQGSDIDKVKESIGLTDSTTIRFHKSNGMGLGFVYLIHGNEEDVITDCSANEWMDGVMKVIEEEIHPS